MQPAAIAASDAVEKLLSLEDRIEEAWRWALAPILDAELAGRELVALASRRDLPYAALRTLAQRALGEDGRTAVVDRWLEQDPEVVAVLGRVRALARQLDGVPARARSASRGAMEIALAAPSLARAAAAEIWQRGPTPDRDALLRTIEGVPAVAKARAEAIRAEAMLVGARAERARARILEGLRARARVANVVRTDRLTPVR